MKSFLKSIIVILATAYRKTHNRFEGALGAACLKEVNNRGKNCKFEGNGMLVDADRLYLGDEVHIGRNFFIRASGGVRVGSHTHISRNVTIHTANHNINGTLLPYDRDDLLSGVEIGEYVWIGMGASILPGVKIGDGAIIGMNTTVSKDVEANAIVVGAGQRTVGTRDADLAERLKIERKFLRIENSWNGNDR